MYTREYGFYSGTMPGAHPKILNALMRTNASNERGYGQDRFTRDAVALMQEEIGNPNATILFVPNGNMANKSVLTTILGPADAVIAAQTGHINVHAGGAIESTGHKILPVPSTDGKIHSEQVLEVVQRHGEHMVRPKAVYVSNATELGTTYSRTELQDLSDTCRSKGLTFYLDGTWLGQAIAAQDSDVSLPDIAEATDVFFIGGTKNGALLGEAVVFNDPNLSTDYKRVLKHDAGLLQKGRIFGVQFSELFDGGNNALFYQLARNADETAQALAEGLRGLGYPFLRDTPTNQIFPLFPSALVNTLNNEFGVQRYWNEVDEGQQAVQLVTSWATTGEEVEGFLSSVASNQ